MDSIEEDAYHQAVCEGEAEQEWLELVAAAELMAEQKPPQSGAAAPPPTMEMVDLNFDDVEDDEVIPSRPRASSIAPRSTYRTMATGEQASVDTSWFPKLLVSRLPTGNRLAKDYPDSACVALLLVGLVGVFVFVVWASTEDTSWPSEPLLGCGPGFTSGQTVLKDTTSQVRTMYSYDLREDERTMEVVQSRLRHSFVSFLFDTQTHEAHKPVLWYTEDAFLNLCLSRATVVVPEASTDLVLTESLPVKGVTAPPSPFPCGTGVGQWSSFMEHPENGCRSFVQDRDYAQQSPQETLASLMPPSVYTTESGETVYYAYDMARNTLVSVPVTGSALPEGARLFLNDTETYRSRLLTTCDNLGHPQLTAVCHEFQRCVLEESFNTTSGSSQECPYADMPPARRPCRCFLRLVGMLHTLTGGSSELRQKSLVLVQAAYAAPCWQQHDSPLMNSGDFMSYDFVCGRTQECRGRVFSECRNQAQTCTVRFEAPIRACYSTVLLYQHHLEASRRF